MGIVKASLGLGRSRIQGFNLGEGPDIMVTRGLENPKAQLVDVMRNYVHVDQLDVWLSKHGEGEIVFYGLTRPTPVEIQYSCQGEWWRCDRDG